jgi:hypothetical protein
MAKYDNKLGFSPFVQLIKLFNNEERKRKGSLFIEFHLGMKKNILSWQDEGIYHADSFYLYFMAFSPMFWECFQDKNGQTQVDTCGVTYFIDNEDLVSTAKLLRKKLKIIESITQPDDLLKVLTHTFFIDDEPKYCLNNPLSELESEGWNGWGKKMKEILKKSLIEVNKGLIEIVDEAIKKEKVLWIFGI